MKMLPLLSTGIMLFALVAPQAHAQAAVYGAVAFTGYGSGTSGYFDDYGDTGGFILGAFYNFPIKSRLTAGVDARFSNSHATEGGTSGAAALRIGLKPHKVPLRPYFEIGVGVVNTSYTSYTTVATSTYPYMQYIPNPHQITNAGIFFAVGLDIRLNSFLDLRLPELSAIGTSSSGVSSDFAAIAAGVVYNFHSR